VHTLPPVVYQSSLVSIRDICAADSCERTEYALPEGAVVFVRSGTFGGSTGRYAFEFDANYIFFGGGRDFIYPHADGGEPCACTIVEYAGATFVGPALDEKLVICSAHAYLKHARLLGALRLGAPESALNDAAVGLICETLTSVSQDPVRHNERSYMVSAIREQVNRSLTKPVSLIALAKQFYLSPFAVSRTFHRETGISLRRYVQRLRLRKALMLMLEHDATLSEIASTLGFYDEPHFSKAFHAEFGMPPARALTKL
jgi:AraC-like DNA-binding protein